jgi:hypothetical protein
MPPRTNPGSVTKLCLCLNRVQLSMICCADCWKTVPRPLQQAYLIARDGDCDSGRALDRASEAIREHLREARP